MLIVYSNEDIGDAYGPSLNMALRQIHAESGIVPVTRSPYGGGRTPAQQQEINPGQYNSDHVKKRGHDLWNFEQIDARIGRARRFAIMARWGWKHVQVNGEPFALGIEDWHTANQLTGLRLLALTVKVIVTPKPKIWTLEEDMLITYTTDPASVKVKTYKAMVVTARAGAVLIDPATGAPMTSAQVAAVGKFFARDKAFFPNGPTNAAVLDVPHERLFLAAATAS